MAAQIRKAAGGIVLGDSGTIAVVRRRPETKWFFPKGHVEGDETDEETARREIEEETGLVNLEFIDDLGSYVRPGILQDGSYNPEETKDIHMFLFAAERGAELAPANEIEACRWVSFSQIAGELEDAKDAVWFATVFQRVRQAIQRD